MSQMDYHALGVNHGLLLVCRLDIHKLLHQMTTALTVALGVMHKTQETVPSDGPNVGKEDS